MSELEDLIYEMIKCFKKWGLWQDGAAFYCSGKKYSACDTDTEGDKFRGLSYVAVTECEEKEEQFVYRRKYGCDMEYEEIPYDIYLSYSPEMVDLYDFGFYSVEIKELSHKKQYEIIEKHPEYMQEYEDEVEDMIKNPDLYPELLSILEFDSADEYIEFRDDFFDEMRNRYISELDKTVMFDNDAEAEICDIISDAGFCYDDEGGGMFIGRDERLMG